MRAVAYPATREDGTVQTLMERKLHEERWSNWMFQSNRRVARRFQEGLDPSYLNEGAYFRIRIFSEDSPTPRYELNALFSSGKLQIVP